MRLSFGRVGERTESAKGNRIDAGSHLGDPSTVSTGLDFRPQAEVTSDNGPLMVLAFPVVSQQVNNLADPKILVVTRTMDCGSSAGAFGGGSFSSPA